MSGQTPERITDARLAEALGAAELVWYGVRGRFGKPGSERIVADWHGWQYVISRWPVPADGMVPMPDADNAVIPATWPPFTGGAQSYYRLHCMPADNGRSGATTRYVGPYATLAMAQTAADVDRL